jgi:hypothetical protein
MKKVMKNTTATGIKATLLGHGLGKELSKKAATEDGGTKKYQRGYPWLQGRNETGSRR